jgi:hypothetical protein
MRPLLFVWVAFGCGADPEADDRPGGRTGSAPDPLPGVDPRLDPGPTETSGSGWPVTVDLRVCADGSEAFREIQDAIAVASSGDVIGVCPGTYGPIEVGYRQALTVIGIEGPERTTIDGGSGTAVYLLEGTLEIRGFRVTGTGVDTKWETDRGGAFTVQEGDLTVRDCVVSGVTGTYALVFDENLLLMEDVVWEDNTSKMLWFLYQGDDATIRRNVVRGGTHQHVAISERVDVLSVTQTLFAGIRIATGFSAFQLVTDGTGPYSLTNDVFYDIDDLDPYGGRVFDIPAVDDFRNNVVADCSAWDLRRFGADYSLFWDNGVDYARSTRGTGNLFVDPMFTDAPGGDFTLSPGSPAIDAGDPGASWADADGTRNDLGIYGGR